MRSIAPRAEQSYRAVEVLDDEDLLGGLPEQPFFCEHRPDRRVAGQPYSDRRTSRDLLRSERPGGCPWRDQHPQPALWPTPPRHQPSKDIRSRDPGPEPGLHAGSSRTPGGGERPEHRSPRRARETGLRTQRERASRHVSSLLSGPGCRQVWTGPLHSAAKCKEASKGEDTPPRLLTSRPLNGLYFTRLISASCPNFAIADNTIAEFAGLFTKPSDGLEPSTPSLPWRIRATAAGIAIRLDLSAFPCIRGECGRSLASPREATETAGDAPNLSPESIPRGVPADGGGEARKPEAPERGAGRDKRPEDVEQHDDDDHRRRAEARSTATPSPFLPASFVMRGLGSTPSTTGDNPRRPKIYDEGGVNDGDDE